jgi:hypothetical protein
MAINANALIHARLIDAGNAAPIDSDYEPLTANRRAASARATMRQRRAAILIAPSASR